MRLSPVLPSFLVASANLLGILFSTSAAVAGEIPAATTRTGGLRNGRATNEVTPDNYWVVPIKDVGLKCIDNSIRAGGGKPLEVCMTEGESLCIDYGFDSPMGGRWQFGILDNKLRLYDPKGAIVWEYCAEVSHICIGEEHGADPNRYSKERPYMMFYNEKTHTVVGNLTCDGTDGEDDKNLGESTMLKLTDNSDIGHYADYPLNILKFKKGQTEDPADDNSLWNITVRYPLQDEFALPQNLLGIVNYNRHKCTWTSQCPLGPCPDISSDGNSLQLGDDEFSQVNLGGDFSFYGMIYNQVYVISNGALSFGNSAGVCQGCGQPVNCCYFGHGPFPNSNTFTLTNAIAPFFADLNPEDGGMIQYRHVMASSDKFVAQWTVVPSFGAQGSATNTFQAVLYFDSGCIQFNYREMDFVDTQGIIASAGVENIDGTIGFNIPIEDILSGKITSVFLCGDPLAPP